MLPPAGTAGLPADLVCGYPQRVAELLTAAAGRLRVPMGTALEVGCSVGGVTLELVRSFERVTGVDLDARAIAAAVAAAAEGSVAVVRKVCGVRSRGLVAGVAGPGMPGASTWHRRAQRPYGI